MHFQGSQNKGLNRCKIKVAYTTSITASLYFLCLRHVVQFTVMSFLFHYLLRCIFQRQVGGDVETFESSVIVKNGMPKFLSSSCWIFYLFKSKSTRSIRHRSLYSWVKFLRKLIVYLSDRFCKSCSYPSSQISPMDYPTCFHPSKGNPVQEFTLRLPLHTAFLIVNKLALVF